MMTTITTIINQNNKTVAYLEDGDYSNAINSSTSAITSLRVWERRRIIQTEEVQGQPKSSSVFESLDQSMLLNESYDDNEIESTHTFVYTCGIRLPSTITDPTIICPILIFNAALVRHMDAEARGSFPEDLQRAKKLYELAYAASQAVVQNSTIFRFVVLNNIAVIDRQLGNTEQSERFIHQLMQTLMLLVDRECTVHLRHLRGFLVNLHGSGEAAGAA